jgi:ppGpp synthetase/RelA/SpoT-type nucleotidyltranferase
MMFVPDSFIASYNNAVIDWEPIKSEVDGIFKKIITENSTVTYSSRIKGIESAFVKAQKGDYEYPFTEMEDFFACQLIIPSKTYYSLVVPQIQEFFEVEILQSKVLPPSSFDYNDTHYVLKLKDSPLRSDKSALKKRFELQVKTFLQSALQQASHDITYKPAKISYWTERIVCQLRALLELADDVLTQIESTTQVLHARSYYEDNHYKVEQKEILQIIESNFSKEQFPNDRRRVAVIIKSYLDIVGISVTQFKEVLEKTKQSNSIIFDFVSLTIPDKVFIILFKNYKDKLIGKFNSGKSKVLITPEMLEFFPELRQLSDNGKIKY